jgi:hypothetical protein
MRLARLARSGIGAVALAGFSLSLLVHALTYAGIDAGAVVPQVWLLHIFCVALGFVFLAVASVIGLVQGEVPDRSHRLPRRARWLLTAAVVYALVNLGALLYLAAGGVPEVSGGRYVLWSHGKVVRELSASEHGWHQASLLRCASSFWMAFYLAFVVHGFRRDGEPAW